jgi:hypothetical protein
MHAYVELIVHGAVSAIHLKNLLAASPLPVADVHGNVIVLAAVPLLKGGDYVVEATATTKPIYRVLRTAARKEVLPNGVSLSVPMAVLEDELRTDQAPKTLPAAWLVPTQARPKPKSIAEKDSFEQRTSLEVEDPTVVNVEYTATSSTSGAFSGLLTLPATTWKKEIVAAVRKDLQDDHALPGYYTLVVMDQVTGSKLAHFNFKL